MKFAAGNELGSLKIRYIDIEIWDRHDLVRTQYVFSENGSDYDSSESGTEAKSKRAHRGAIGLWTSQMTAKPGTALITYGHADGFCR